MNTKCHFKAAVLKLEVATLWSVAEFLQKGSQKFKNFIYSQTWANAHLWIATTCLQQQLFYRPVFHIYSTKEPLNNGHKFGVTRVVVVLRFDCIILSNKEKKRNLNEDFLHLKGRTSFRVSWVFVAQFFWSPIKNVLEALLLGTS